MSVTIRMDAVAVIKALGNVVKNLPRELEIIASKTAKETESIIAKQVTEHHAVLQRDVKKQISRRKIGKTGAEVALAKSKRIPLRDFSARETKSGVTYRIEKGGKRKKIKTAFKLERLRGRVFRREDKERLPIIQLFGPSPWGVFKKHKLNVPSTKQIKKEMNEQASERLRYQTLKKDGVI